MTRTAKWIVAALAVLVLGLAGLWLLVRAWLPGDQELAAQIATRFESSLGIGLTVGMAHWSLRPVPVIVVENVATAQSPPITVRRIALRPQLAALWRRELAFDSLEVEGAVLPAASVRALGDRLPEGDPLARAMGTDWRLADVPLTQVRLRDVTWTDRRDIGLAYDAEAEFDAPGWRPRTAEVRRAGVSPPVRLRLEREAGQSSRWRTLIDVGGGSWNGSTTLEEAQAGGPLRLSSQLEASNVDIESLAAAFGRRSPVAGKLAGQTDVRAEAEKLGGLVRALRTHTTFTVRPAILTRLDLVKAVSTAGISRGGQTRLDELGGTLDTQATDDGVLMRYTQLRARSGLLKASGSARLLNRKLDGEAAVDLVDGVLGVPLKIGGTVDEPELSLTGGALTGAAIGSAVLPGVGTAIGARLGQRVEEMFGGGKRGKDKKQSPTAQPAHSPPPSTPGSARSDARP